MIDLYRPMIDLYRPFLARRPPSLSPFFSFVTFGESRNSKRVTTHTAKSAVNNKSVTPHEDVYAMSKRTELLAQDPRSLERSAGPLSNSYGAGGRARRER